MTWSNEFYSSPLPHPPPPLTQMNLLKTIAISCSCSLFLNRSRRNCATTVLRQVDCFCGDARNRCRWRERRMFWVTWQNAREHIPSSCVAQFFLCASSQSSIFARGGREGGALQSLIRGGSASRSSSETQGLLAGTMQYFLGESFSSWIKLSPKNIASSRLVVPESPRMPRGPTPYPFMYHFGRKGTQQFRRFFVTACMREKNTHLELLDDTTDTVYIVQGNCILINVGILQYRLNVAFL